MHTLLHLEELQQEVDVRSYDMKNAQLIVSGRYLALKVCGMRGLCPAVWIGAYCFLIGAYCFFWQT